MASWLTALYLLAWLGLTLYGALGVVTLALFWRHRQGEPVPASLPDAWPNVTVQLPIYNERHVVERLIAGAVALDYPADYLEIQVVDDSDDETGDIVARLVNLYRSRGVDIVHCRRFHRGGFKAGALARATAVARGEFIAIFDADFIPPRDFLRRTIPHFTCSPELGAVQARWGHLNAGDGPLTAAQAIALDKHFAVEQMVRHRANLFPKFNGAAGVWRRSCIEACGGWEGDTVCEDLCLSTRAALDGWRFHYVDQLVAPAELPATVTAYKNQQARWAKGSLQCLRKFGRAIARSRRHPPLARAYALLSMTAYLTQPLLLVLLLMHLPFLVAGQPLPAWLAPVSLLGLGQPLLFVVAQRRLHADWCRRLRHLPALLVLAVGTAPAVSRALGQVIIRGPHPFVRTPKSGAAAALPYLPPPDSLWRLEAALAAYAAAAMLLALYLGRPDALWLPATCALGLGLVAWRSYREQRYRAAATAPRSLPLHPLSGD